MQPIYLMLDAGIQIKCKYLLQCHYLQQYISSMRRVLLAACLIYAALCSCAITQNTKPLITSEPKLLGSVTNGQKMIVGDLQDPQMNYIYIANLKGTPKQMGKAFGQLFSKQINETLKAFYDYYIGQLQTIIQSKLPAFLAQKVSLGVEGLLKRILDVNVMITKKYTNPRYYEEIAGIAEGSKIPAKDIKRLNMFPELIKAACTVAGLWKEATSNGQVIHMRALDWDSKNPISRTPVIIVYHPTGANLQTHANFGWTGFVGSMTGMSPKISLGEKVWLPKKGSVKMTRYGNPWTYVFRDLLYDATDIKSALAILSTTHRTCAIHIGLASAEGDFRMFQYAERTLNNYNDKNYTHYNAGHPNKSGVAFFDKHVQPSGDNCTGLLLTNSQLYGHWTAESMWRYLGFSAQTGDTQLAVFDLTNQIAIVSYSSGDGKTKAFERAPFSIDMGALFQPF